MTARSSTATSVASRAAVLGGLTVILGALVALLAAQDAPAFLVGLLMGVLVVAMIAVGVNLGVAIAADRRRADRARLDEIDPLGGLRQGDQR